MIGLIVALPTVLGYEKTLLDFAGNARYAPTRLRGGSNQLCQVIGQPLAKYQILLRRESVRARAGSHRNASTRVQTMGSPAVFIDALSRTGHSVPS